MSIFKRLFKVGQAEANAAVDKLENPIKMTEQGIRDMKKDLEKSLTAMAEVKAMAIRSKTELHQSQEQAKDYEQKAMLLLKKAQAGNMDMNEAERLATEALARKEEAMQTAERTKTEYDKLTQSTTQLEGNVKKLRSNIGKWENELKTLKARVKVSAATQKLNKQLAQIDSTNTVSMLEKMKEKVNQQEALAESYGDMAMESRSIDEEIDQALEQNTKGTQSLEDLKKKMGL